MANFKTHLSVAFVASGLAGLALLKVRALTPAVFVACVVAGTVGGLLPDLDSDHSTPLSIGFTVLALLTAFAVVIGCAERFSVLELLALWALTFVTIRWGVFRFFNSITVHRGMMHSVPYMLLYGFIALYGAVYGLHLPVAASWLVAIFVSMGTLVHLVLDEVYSVNLLNVRIKKSFGTALKFYSPRQKGRYVLLYAFVALAWWLAPSSQGLLEGLADPQLWHRSTELFWPQW